MAKIFITGSSDGLGLLAAQELINQGNEVVLHARNDERAAHASQKIKGAKAVLVADLAKLQETKALAEQVNDLGPFDAIIHNAGIYENQGNTIEGLPVLYMVNCVAPYVLTALIKKPKRLIYLSSDMHLQGHADHLPSNGVKNISYSDTKLHDLILCKAVAKKWNDVYVNALHPGWVPTKMGGANAPDDLKKGFETQVWLATSNDEETTVSGCYFHHKKQKRYLPIADDEKVQKNLLDYLENATGIKMPD